MAWGYDQDRLIKIAYVRSVFITAIKEAGDISEAQAKAITAGDIELSTLASVAYLSEDEVNAIKAILSLAPRLTAWEKSTADFNSWTAAGDELARGLMDISDDPPVERKKNYQATAKGMKDDALEMAGLAGKAGGNFAAASLGLGSFAIAAVIAILLFKGR